jgi:hypothetical protein
MPGGIVSGTAEGRSFQFNVESKILLQALQQFFRLGNDLLAYTVAC